MRNRHEELGMCLGPRKSQGFGNVHDERDQCVLFLSSHVLVSALWWSCKKSVEKVIEDWYSSFNVCEVVRA